MGVIAVVFSLFSVWLAVLSFLSLILGILCLWSGMSYFFEWSYFYSGSVGMEVSVVVDWMSMLFLSVVAGVSSSVSSYSSYYMGEDEDHKRFMVLLGLFVGSMFILILSMNLVSMLLGWDGLGLISYLLVIYYQNSSSEYSGMLTIMSNRIGDVAILMSIGLMVSSGSWNYIFASGAGFFFSFMILIAGCTKSAQAPFSAWLPAAMSAPTPVSALVHSSTLVTAGVYLVIRFAEIIKGSGAMSMLVIISCTTLVISGVSAFMESDLKKVIAYSTLSQLSIMMISVGCGMVNVAFFHLIVHAVLKSTLFMSAGYFIHSLSGYQDSRVFSTFSLGCPLLSVFVGGSNLCLLGFPFMAGFYSKDMIVESLGASSFSLLIVSLVWLGCCLTILYSFRFMWLCSGNIGVSGVMSPSGDSNKRVTGSLVGLYLGCCGYGCMISWFIFSCISPMVLSLFVKAVILIIMWGVMSICGGWMVTKGLGRTKIMMLSWGSGKIGYLMVMNMVVSMLGVFMGGVKYKVGDKAWVEEYSGSGGMHTMGGVSMGLQMSQSSSMVNKYMLGFVSLSLLLMMSWFILLC